MLLRQLFDKETSTYTYLLAKAGKAVMIDPVVGQLERDLKLLGQLDLTLEYAVDTHVHADHVTGTGALRQRTGCTSVTSSMGPESAELRLGQGDVLEFGGQRMQALATPGHTDDSMSLWVEGQVFTGDTLLIRGCGRSDFQNGDAGVLYESITTRLFTLDDDTVVWPGHDYAGHTRSTIGEEKRHNPRLAGKSRQEFVQIMSNLRLPPPRQLDHAVPANWELGLGVGRGVGDARFGECTASQAQKWGSWDTVIDVREPHEFSGELGHIPNARNLPMGQFPQIAGALDRGKAFLVVCRSGGRSRKVCQQLVDLGFENVTNLSDGMLGYCKHGDEVA